MATKPHAKPSKQERPEEELNALRERVHALEAELAEQRHFRDTIEAVFREASVTTGEGFAPVMVRDLARALGVKYAFIGEAIDADDTLYVKTVALWTGDDHAENITYDTRGTPCEDVLVHGVCVHPRGVQAAFPDDDILRDMGVESYVGTPLHDTDGRLLGILAVLDTAELTDPDAVCAVIEAVAPRTGAELARQRAERARRVTDERFRLLAEQVPGTIYLCRNDERYTMLYLSSEVERLTGYPPEDFLEQRVSFVDLYHPDDVDRIAPCVETALAHNKPFHLEYRLRHRDGSWRWVEEFGSAVVHEGDTDGIQLLEGFLGDITAKKQAEEELNEITERFQTAFEKAAIGMALVSTDGLFLQVNQSFCEMLGYGEAEMLTMGFFDITHPDDLEASREINQRLRSGEASSCRMEKRYIHKDGHEVWGLLNATVINDGEGKPRYFIAEIEDITQSKRAIAERDESVSKLRATLEATHDGILVVDPEGRITDYNKRFVELWRIPEDILIQRDDDGAIEYVLDQLADPKGFVERIKQLYGRVDAEAHDVIEFKDGRVFQRSSRPQVLGGKTVGRVWSFRDITKQKEFELAMARSVEQERQFKNDLATLLDISNELATADSQDTLCRRAVEIGRERLGFDRLGIWFLDADQTRLEGSFGTDENGNIRDERGTRLPLRMKTRERLLSENPFATLLGRDAPLRGEGGNVVGHGSHVMAPMWNGEQILGCVFADNLMNGHEMTERDIEILAMYASSIGHLCFRKRAEHALMESEARLKGVIESLPLVLMSVEALTNRFILIIGDVERVLGCPADRFLNDPDFGASIIHPDDVERVRAAFEQGLATHEPFSIEFRIISQAKPGPVWLFQRVVPIVDDQDQLVRHDNVIVDITERKAAEESLRRSEEQLSSVVTSSPIILFAIDRHGTIRLSRGKGLESLNLRPDETVGRSVFEMYADHYEIIEDVKRALGGESFTTTAEVSGKIFETRYSPLLNDKGELDGTIGVAVDITENVKLQKQLYKTQKLESIGTLAGGIAHDYNNLLAVIIGHASIHLRDTSLPDRLLESLRDIMNAAERGSSLSHQLLAYARGGLQKPAPTDINRLIHRVMEILQRTTEPGIELKLTLAESLPPIMADPTQIEQVIMNLCVNAIQASTSPGRIHIKTFLREPSAVEATSGDSDSAKAVDEVALIVEDNGCGMTEEVLGRIFEPFYSTKQDTMSRGMGLSATLGIVESHKGRIGVESKAGEGTRVTVYLPVAREGIATADAVDPHRHAAPMRGSETILVADDDPSVVRTVEMILSSLGYPVMAYNNIDDLLAMLDTNAEDVDLVLLDVNMPKYTTEEAYAEIRKRCPHCRILLASGFDRPDPVDRLMKQGASGFMPKPFTMLSLSTAIRNALDRKPS